MKGIQLSFDFTNTKPVIGSVVEIIIFSRENKGIITRLSLTKKWALVSYTYKDDPLQEVKYAYFNIKDELRII